MNDQRDPGSDEPGEDDTFDHFFSNRPPADPDATRPVPQTPPPGGPDDATAAWTGQAPQQPAGGSPDGPTQGWPAGPPPQQPYAAGPAEPPPPDHRRSGMALPLVVIAVSLVVIAIVLFLTLGNWGTSTQATPSGSLPPATMSSGPSTPTDSASSGPTTPSETPSDSSSSPTHEALPDGATDCHSTAFTVGPKTSCSFGKQVANAAEGADYSDGSAKLKGIYSPTTHKKYTLTCTQGGYLTCVSTTGAVVYVKNP